MLKYIAFKKMNYPERFKRRSMKLPTSGRRPRVIQELIYLAVWRCII